MSNSRANIAAPDVHDPLAENGCIDERIHPHRLCHRRTRGCERPQRVPLDINGFQLRQCLHIMIGALQEQMLEIKNVSRHMERDDLAGALSRKLLPVDAANCDARMGPQLLPQGIAEPGDREFCR